MPPMNPSTATPSIAAPHAWESPQEVRPDSAPTKQGRGRVEKSANWFFWVAALSLINTAILLSGKQWAFIIGLGFTQLVDAVLGTFGPVGMAVALCIDACVFGVFIVMGVFARRLHMWAFIVGLVLYGADGLIFLLVGDIPSIAFHAFVVFNLWTGVKALRAAPQK
jgi:hypothetical protein